MAAIRNFWVDAEVDGRANKLAGGPIAKTGGLTVSIKQRDNGSITEPYNIRSYVDFNGDLCTQIYKNGTLLDTHTTKR